MKPFEPYKTDTEFNKPASYGPHEGLDLNGLMGGNTDCLTPIKAIQPGTIIHTSKSFKDYGFLLVVETIFNNSVYYVRYCHLDSFTRKSGDTVAAGDVIGLMGNTGNSNFCHLHLDVLKKKPPHWRFYSKDVLEWFEDPIKLIEGKKMPDMYEGYDLNNKKSMKIAVDVLVKLMKGELVEAGAVQNVNMDEWEENGLTVQSVSGNTTTIVNYKKK